MQKKQEKPPIDWKTETRRYGFAILGALLFSLNLNTFVEAGGLYPGGVNGVTLLIQNSLQHFAGIKVPFSAINFPLNLIPVLIGFRKVGVRFTASSCVVIVLTGLLTDLLPVYPITYDILLISVFGGLLHGLAICIGLWGGASSGGTDIVAIYFSKKYGIDIWNYILGFNAIILLVSGALYGWNIALYSIIFQFTCTQTINLLHRSYKKMTLIVVTDEPDTVAEAINQETHHGATKLAGAGCYHNENRNLVYSVVSHMEVRKLVNRIHEVDQKAFINVVKTEYIMGRFHQEMNY